MGCGGCGPSDYGENCGECYYSCRNSCQGSCNGGCKGGCYGCGGCDNTCDGCSGTCTGHCKNSCKGTCGATCTGACNSGCKDGVAKDAFNALAGKLNEYITQQDLNNIYLIFQAIRDRRSDSGISTEKLPSISFVQHNDIMQEDISKLSETAKYINYSISDTENEKIIQNQLFYKTTAQALLDQAITGYNTTYKRGSIT